ncbi:hypothetical protein IT401_01720 [Candidatus Nomurabacteria bacterium]|nr:hypothetical protein [Candidatus Nomurabacteria bacterium]
MAINEFVAKKLGEILAFERVGQDTLERGRVALEEALGQERITDREEKIRLYSEAILRTATDAGVVDTTLTKASATENKLKKMRDLYVGDQWDNATELLEWSGFFEGAAIVHYALVRGAAEGLGDEALMTLAEEAKNYHYELLELAESELETKGQDKATA